MSALGQKQTYAVQLGDVRFVPIADMIAPHGLHNHAENSARRTCRAQELLTSHSLLCAGRHSWSHVRAPCTNIGAVLGQSAPGTAYKRKSVLF